MTRIGHRETGLTAIIADGGLNFACTLPFVKMLDYG